MDHQVLKMSLSAVALLLVTVSGHEVLAQSPPPANTAVKRPLPKRNRLEHPGRRAYAAKTRKLLRQGDRRVGKPEGWRADGAHTSQYETTFSRLLGRQQFSDVLKEHRARTGRPTHVMDLFGSGFQFEQGSSADSVLGVRLGPYHGDVPSGKRSELHGNLIRPRSQVWNKIDRHMHQKGIKGFSLITMRPEGGLGSLVYSDPADAVHLFTKLVENAARRLDPQGGRLFVQVPTYFHFSGHELGREIPNIVKKIGEKYDVRIPSLNQTCFSFEVRAGGKAGVTELTPKRMKITPPAADDPSFWGQDKL